MAENKTQETNNSVAEFITSLNDEQVASDCLNLVQIMSDISGHEPKMWGASIIGFDAYHYKYDSGREGDAPVVAFSPRKGKITVYVNETAQYPELLAKLGKHSLGKVCVYFKHLSDIDMAVLAQIIGKSYQGTKSLYAEDQ